MSHARTTGQLINAAALVLLMAGGASAQNSASADVNVSLDPVVLITSSGATNFGVIPNLPGLSVAINPLQPGPGQSVAHFTIPGLGISQYEVWMPCAIDLHASSGDGNVIRFQPSLLFSLADGSHGTLDDVNCESTMGVLLETGLGWETVIALGGSLTLGPSLSPGQYTGSYTISIAIPGY